MAKGYIVNLRYIPEIEEIEIIRETEKTVTVKSKYSAKPYRMNKKSVDSRFFSTIAETLEFFTEQIDKKIESHENDIKRLKDRMEVTRRIYGNA